MSPDYLNNSSKERLQDFFYILTPLTFFCSIKIFNISLVLSSVLVLFCVFSDTKQLKDRNWKATIVLIIPFLIFFYGFLIDVFAGNIREGWHSLEKFLPIVLYAILVIITNPSSKRVELSKLSFFSGCIVAALFCIGMAFWKNFTDHERIIHNWNFEETLKFYENNPIGLVNWGFFLYTEFADAINFHPTYLSIYFIVAIVFAVSILKNNLLLNSLVIAGILLLIGCVLLLSSKISLILLFVLLLFVSSYFFSRLTRMARVVVGGVLIFAIAIPLLFPVSVYRLQTIFNDSKSTDLRGDLSSTSLHRIYLWENAIKLFNKNPLIGYGLFGADVAQRTALEQNKSTYFNTHNQYLMILLCSGVFGLLSFFIMHSVLFFSSIKASDYIYTVFLIILLVSLLTENLISRHTGSILYSFFNALFFIHLLIQKNEKI